MRLITASIFAFIASFAFAAELLMVEAPGCAYCLKWDKEVGAKYPKTDLGQELPLQKISKSQIQSNVDLQRPVIYTPTFIFADNGKEFARLEGYQSEDFFWALSEEILAQHKKRN